MSTADSNSTRSQIRGFIPVNANARYRTRLFVLLFTLTVTNLLFAEVYKWVDETGKTHYSDKPHNDDAELIRLKKKPELDADHNIRVEKQRRLLEVLEGEHEDTTQQKAQAAAEKRQREINCKKARKNLQNIKNAGFLYKKADDPRNPIVYSDEERSEITRKAKKAVETWCK